MNYDKNCQYCKSDSEFAKCKPKHPEPQNILLECGEGTGSRTFTSSDDVPFQLASVTLDTTGLNRQEVLIKFSSLVRVERLGGSASVRLQYELSRTWEDGNSISLGTWIFEKVNISTSDFDRAAEESFNFIFCECQACSKCCDYFVTVTPIEIANVTVTVSNGRMAALTQYLHDFSKDKCTICELNNKCEKSKTTFSKPKETILTCGKGTGDVFFRTQNEPSVVVANVEIDTSGLCKPKILIEFSTIVDYLEGGSPNSTVSLQFELFRACDNRDPISLSVWNYEVGVITGVIQSRQGLGFTFCECINFAGCCEYFVKLTPNEVATDTFDNVTISNSRMTALAQSSQTCVKECETTEYKLKNSKFKDILLECGSGTGSKTFTSSEDSTFILAQVMVATKKLYKSTVNIEFSSIVSYEEIDGSLNGVLRYELFRVCDDGRPKSQAIWSPARIEQDSDKITGTFDFTFCETLTCKSDCCTYFVKVTPIEIENGQVTVSNGRIAALVQEGW